jgi:hypothetical protein
MNNFSLLRLINNDFSNVRQDLDGKNPVSGMKIDQYYSNSNGREPEFPEPGAESQS